MVIRSKNIFSPKVTSEVVHHKHLWGLDFIGTTRSKELSFDKNLFHWNSEIPHWFLRNTCFRNNYKMPTIWSLVGVRYIYILPTNAVHSKLWAQYKHCQQVARFLSQLTTTCVESKGKGHRGLFHVFLVDVSHLFARRLTQIKWKTLTRS